MGTPIHCKRFYVLYDHQMAVATDNRDFARFLYDAMMFEMLPYWAPIAAAAALTSGLFFCIQVTNTCIVPRSATIAG